jgi:hypothetical protein
MYTVAPGTMALLSFPGSKSFAVPSLLRALRSNEEPQRKIQCGFDPMRNGKAR